MLSELPSLANTNANDNLSLKMSFWDFTRFILKVWYRPTRVVPDQRPLNGRRYFEGVVAILNIYDKFL